MFPSALSHSMGLWDGQRKILFLSSRFPKIKTLNPRLPLLSLLKPISSKWMSKVVEHHGPMGHGENRHLNSTVGLLSNRN
jgi:hypothetical protein